MSSGLQIADGFSLPTEAVTETFALLAKRGSGKSYAASVLVEEMLEHQLQVVVLDPMGIYWGLRATADGKDAGYPIVILGGDHGDVPLELGAGELAADLVVDEHLSCVLDISGFRKGERKQFVVAFAERLYHRNRDPVHLVLEEADLVAPQKPLKGEERMLGAIEDLVRRGRQRGIGITLITQRSAVLNKDVLTQTEVLIALRTTSPQDRAAIEAWVDAHANPDERRKVLDTLATLPVGEAWVSSPGWLGTLQRVRIRPRRTFDSSATPKAGQRRAEPKTVADVDLGALQQRMAATIEKAKADDPRELRRQIAELTKRCDRAERERAIIEVSFNELEDSFNELGSKARERVEVPAIAKADLDVLRRLVDDVKELVVSAAPAVGRVVDGLELAETRAAAEGTGRGAPSQVPAPAGPLSGDAPLLPQPARARPGSGDGRPSNTQAGHSREARHASERPGGRLSVLEDSPPAGPHDITVPQQRILDALAWLDAAGITEPTRPAVAFLAATRPTSGGFKNNLGALRTAGLIDYPAPSRVQLTDRGHRAADQPEQAISPQQFQHQVQARVTVPQWRILVELINAYPDMLGREDLAQAIDVPSTSGGFKNNLGALRTLELIDYPSPGYVTALPVLFPGAAP